MTNCEKTHVRVNTPEHVHPAVDSSGGGGILDVQHVDRQRAPRDVLGDLIRHLTNDLPRRVPDFLRVYVRC